MFKALSQTPSFLPYLSLYPTSSSTYLFETFLVCVSFVKKSYYSNVNSQVFKLARQTTARGENVATKLPQNGVNFLFPFPAYHVLHFHWHVLNELPFMGHLSSRPNTHPLLLNRPFALPRLSTLRPVVISSSLLSVGSLLPSAHGAVQGRINRLLPIKCSFVFYCISAFSLPCQCLLPSMPCQ